MPNAHPVVLDARYPTDCDRYGWSSIDGRAVLATAITGHLHDITVSYTLDNSISYMPPWPGAWLTELPL